MIISIDGPAASGKSTTARLLANKLSFKHLNTGMFYRAVTYAFIQQKIFVKQDLINEKLIHALFLVLYNRSNYKLFDYLVIFYYFL